MKKKILALFLFCTFLLGSLTFLQAATFGLEDTGAIGIIRPKNGGIILNYSLPTDYLDINGKPNSQVKISIYDNKGNLLYRVETLELSIELSSTQSFAGSYNISICIDDYTYSQFVVF